MNINQLRLSKVMRFIILFTITFIINLNLHGQANLKRVNSELMELIGSPKTEGHFVSRIKLPAGFSSELLSHTGDYHITVLKGNLYVSFENNLDSINSQLFKTGTYFIIPANQIYHQWVKEETLLQVNGVGPIKTLKSESSGVSGVPLNKVTGISIDSSMVSANMIKMHGEMTKEGPFSIRVKFNAGTILNPHRHNNDHYVTVLKGKLIIGYGEKFDFAKSDTIRTGALLYIEASKIHFEQFSEEAIVQIHGSGPFRTEMIKSTQSDGKN